MASGNVSIKTFFFAVMGIVLIETAANCLLPWDIQFRLWMIGLTRVLQIVFLILLLMGSGIGLKAIHFSPDQWRTGGKRGLVWAAGFGIVVLVVAGCLALAGINPLMFFQMKSKPHLDQIIGYLIVGGIIGPIAEELVFRGIVYTFFRRWGMWIALAISTVLFILPHKHPGIPQIIGSLLFALAYETEKNLMAPITIHVLGNLTIFVVTMIQWIK